MKELARELRIGNLLYSTRKIPFAVTLEDLAQIEEGSQAEAIPLTEEWLEQAPKGLVIPEWIQYVHELQNWYYWNNKKIEIFR